MQGSASVLRVALSHYTHSLLLPQTGETRGISSLATRSILLRKFSFHARYVSLTGDHEPFDGFRIVATPGHTNGHQSLVVETANGRVVLAGQAVYTVEEWAGSPDELEGRSGAPDQRAYDQSLDRLRELEPQQVFFGHDRRSWQRMEPG